jgi:hypothetical protein
MPTPEQDEIRFAAIEADIANLKEKVKDNRQELGANSRGSLTFAFSLVIMLLLGSRFSAESGYSYAIELEKLTTLIGLPAIAALFAAVVPGLRK